MSEPDQQGGGQPAADVSRTDLREAALGGVRWVVLARVASEAGALAASVALARMIVPSEFGAVAVALLVQAVAIVLTTGGIGSSLVQRGSIGEEHVGSAMALSLLLGAAGTSIVFLLAPLAAPALGESTASALRLMSPIFLILALGATSGALLTRQLDFRALSLSEIAGATVGLLVSVSLAVAGLDAEALIIGALAGGSVQTLIVLLKVPPAVPRWHPRTVRELCGFGVPAAVGSTGHTAFMQVDYAIVATQMSLAQVGFYWRAYHLTFDFQHRISLVMQQIAFPVYSRARDLAHMRQLRFRIVRAHGTVMFPLLFFLIALAPDLVPWLYGQSWEPAVVPVQILAVAALPVPILAGSGPLMLAAGRPRALMLVNWVTAASYAAVILVAARYGLTATCIAVAAFQMVKLAVIQHFVIRRLLGVSTRQVFSEVAPALGAGLALLGVALLAERLLGAAGAPDWLSVAAAGIAGAATYLLILARRYPAAWRDAATLAHRVLARDPDDGTPAMAASLSRPGVEGVPS